MTPQEDQITTTEDAGGKRTSAKASIVQQKFFFRFYIYIFNTILLKCLKLYCTKRSLVNLRRVLSKSQHGFLLFAKTTLR